MSEDYDNLKLKEVIWEVTRKCGKNCKYCGSKAVLEPENPQLDNLLRIAREIADYGVKVVTLSGGELGELPAGDLFAILEVLKSGGCDIRAVTNGKLLELIGPVEARRKFNVIGLSVNSSGDIPSNLRGYDRYTMITNFGTHNIWEFDKLAETAKSFGTWQIQLTMGEFLLPPEGIAHLREKIRQLKDVKYVLADNLQDQHKCTAGITSCGITSDGLVIPCLSERSCNASGGVTAEGNLFIDSLKRIWENNFKEIRFGGDGWRNRCRNCIKYPDVKQLTPTIQRFRAVELPESSGTDPIMPPFEVRLYGVEPYDVQVYGVQPSDIQVYGVTTPPRRRYTGSKVMAYGVTDYSVIAACDHRELLQK